MSIKLLKQSSLYSFGKLFAFLAGLISYPILTKTLSVTEYGTVALLTVSIGLMSTFIKLGVQQSIIRFKQEIDTKTFSSNIIALSVSSTTAAIFFLILVGFLVRSYSDIVIFQQPFFVVILFSAALQALQSFCINLLISSEKSIAVTSFGMIYKLFSLSTMLIAILIISATSFSFVVALLVADLLYFLVLLFWIFKKNYLVGFDFSLVDKKIINSLLVFGVPMFGYELSNMFHAFLDRFLIEIYLGRESLGLYSASYNMAKMISDLILGGVITAILPQYLSLWKNKGKEATEQLLSKVNDVILLVLPIVIVGIYATSSNLLAILTTEQYVKHAYLLPIIVCGTFLFNLGIIYSAGLQIQKQSKTMLRIVIESALINLVLNIIFIPKYGMISAAVNTFVSYFWASLRFYFSSRKILRITFDGGLLLRAVGYSLVMYWAILPLEWASQLTSLIAKTLVGALIALILIISFEKKIRKEAVFLVKNKLVRKP